MDLKKVKEILMSFKMEEEVIQKAAIEIKYEGYLKKEEEMLLAKKKLENVKIPHDLDIQEIEGLTGEERELMSKYKPSNLKEAERYCGLRPASVDKILFIVKRNEKRRKS